MVDKNFEEKSGLTTCKTSWGNWGQTIEDIHIEVNLKKGTSAKSISCTIETSHLTIKVNGCIVIKVTIMMIF